MDDRELRCEALLAAYRDDEELDEVTITRLERRLARNLDRELPWDREVATDSAGASRRRWVIGATVAIAAAVLLWMSLRGSMLSRSEGDARNAAEYAAEGRVPGGAAVERTDDADPSRAHPAARSDRASSPIADETVDSAAPEPGISAPLAPAPSTHAPATDDRSPASDTQATARKPSSTRDDRKPTRPAAPELAPAPLEPEPTPSLAVEVQLLLEADQALRNGKPALALSKLDQIDRAATTGALRHETAALDIVARCQLGHGDAGTRAARFLDRAPESTYRRRIELACGEPVP